jgi:TRAP transporter TAXI family solute receptor
VKNDKKFVSDMESEEELNLKNLPAYQRYLKRLEVLSSNIKKNPENLEAFENSLNKVLIQTEIKVDSEKNYMGIATAHEDGEYFLFGKAMESVLATKINKVKSYSTFGSAHNIELVSRGELKFGIAQGDLLKNVKSRKNNLRAIMSLFPEAIKIICLKTSKFKNVSDLTNKKVNIGPVGSGSRFNAIQLLNAHSITQEDVTTSNYTLKTALKELAKKSIDAIVLTGTYPFNSLVNFSNQTPFRLLNSSEEALSSLSNTGNLIRLSVAKNTYPNQDQDYKTVGTTAVLFSTSDVTPTEVSTLLKGLFDKQSKLAQLHSKASEFSKENWRKGIDIPIHEGSKKFFK